MIPEFAVIGHPNEGKSSVVSTLTENDKIAVSRYPGETTVSQTYTVKIDGQSVIRFVDTPGFQVPRQTLSWFKGFSGAPDEIVREFISAHKDDAFFVDECELFAPVANGAGIIYVVDGSRPVRDEDLFEMEILRLTGRPRIAIINSKKVKADYTEQWRVEFRKQFNAIRVFNSNTAGFSDRMKMLESLKSIDQEWEDRLSEVILCFEEDWHKRNRLAAALIAETLDNCLSFSVSRPLLEQESQKSVQERLNKTYQLKIKQIEIKMFAQIRSLFKHHLYEVQLPESSLLQHDLFSKKTWELLGLTKGQLAAAGAIAGGTMGAVVDTAAGGATFGAFSLIGGLLGAGSTLYGVKKLAGKKTGNFQLGGDKIRVGPSKNPQFLYILIDRVLIYYAHIVNRPHGRRDGDQGTPSGRIGSDAIGKKGFTTGFDTDQKKLCATLLRKSVFQSFGKKKKALSEFQAMMETVLNEISSGRYTS